jgi:hypothetical protein
MPSRRIDATMRAMAGLTGVVVARFVSAEIVTCGLRPGLIVTQVATRTRPCGQVSVLRKWPHQTSRHPIPGVATTAKAAKIRGINQRVGIAVRCRGRLALRSDPCYQNANFSGDAGA